MEKLTYAQWVAFAVRQLQQNTKNDPFIQPKVDAEILLQTATKCTKTALLAYPETLLNPAEIQQLNQWLQRRLKHEPIAYILGHKAFWSLELAVSPYTLIPRPDTEILVEHAIEYAKVRLKSPQFLQQNTFSILDLGTGTGAIALALAKELLPFAKSDNVTLKVLGVDRIPEAVFLAKSNAEKNGLNWVNFCQSHWFCALSSHCFDMIVANPPYIDEQDHHLNQGDVRFEPRSALVALEQGYADLRHIIEQAPAYLTPQGSLWLEHGWQQGEKVRSDFTQKNWKNVTTFCDYGGNERITTACIGSIES